jgi:hypothetical protein
MVFLIGIPLLESPLTTIKSAICFSLIGAKSVHRISASVLPMKNCNQNRALRQRPEHGGGAAYGLGTLRPEMLHSLSARAQLSAAHLACAAAQRSKTIPSEPFDRHTLPLNASSPPLDGDHLTKATKRVLIQRVTKYDWLGRDVRYWTHWTWRHVKHQLHLTLMPPRR